MANEATDNGRNLPQALPELTSDNFPCYRLITIPTTVDQADLLRRFKSEARPEYGDVVPNQFFGGARRVANSSRFDFYAGVAKRGCIEIYGTSDDIANRMEGLVTKLVNPPKAADAN